MEKLTINELLDAYDNIMRVTTSGTPLYQRAESVHYYLQQLLHYQKLGVSFDHLRDLLQAEQDGRLVVLQCKVGATVYGHSKAEVYEYKVAVISLATYNWYYLRCQNHNSDFWVTDADIGKTVFLTREEAEAALAGKGGTHEADSV